MRLDEQRWRSQHKAGVRNTTATWFPSPAKPGNWQNANNDVSCPQDGWFTPCFTITHTHSRRIKEVKHENDGETQSHQHDDQNQSLWFNNASSDNDFFCGYTQDSNSKLLFNQKSKQHYNLSEEKHHTERSVFSIGQNNVTVAAPRVRTEWTNIRTTAHPGLFKSRLKTHYSRLLFTISTLFLMCTYTFCNIHSFVSTPSSIEVFCCLFKYCLMVLSHTTLSSF